MQWFTILKLIFYPSVQTFALSGQNNRLIENVLLSTQNVSFGLRNKKINLESPPFTVPGDLIRPNKKISVFGVTGQNILGRVDIHIFLIIFFIEKI